MYILKSFHTTGGKDDGGRDEARKKKQDLSEEPGVDGVRQNVQRPVATVDPRGSGTGNGLYWKAGKEAERAAYYRFTLGIINLGVSLSRITHASARQECEWEAKEEKTRAAAGRQTVSAADDSTRRRECDLKAGEFLDYF